MEKHSQPPPYTQNVPPYMHQQGGMGMPQPGMGMPQPGMGMPQPGMGMPQPGTGMPQPGMYPTITVPPPAGDIIIISQQPRPWGEYPIRMACPYCHSEVTTRTKTKVKSSGILCSGLLCLTGMWLCFWIPCFMSGCQEVDHSCPVCQANLGTYDK